MNRIRCKEELDTLLNRYRGVLDNSMMEYLNSLIKLEFSAVSDYITDDEKEALSELEIYKQVARFNICNRTLKLLSHNKKLSNMIVDDNSGILNSSVRTGNDIINLFGFDYRDCGPFERIPDGLSTKKIGNISLYQVLDNSEVREAELSRVIERLEKLYDEKNPYAALPNRYGGPSCSWEFEHMREIRDYEMLFNELDSKIGLSDAEKREIEIKNIAYDILLTDYNLDAGSFEEEFTPFKRSDSKLEKKLVKKKPNLTITSNIKYI